MANPYLQQQMDALQKQSNQNLQQNILPGINSGAVAAGGYGGSRQGIAQGIGIGNAQTGFDAAAANLYGNAYEGDQARANTASIAAMQNATQQQANENQYKLGLGNLGLGYFNGGNNYTLGLGGLSINQQNANTNQAMTGANIANMGQQGLGAAGQNLYNLGLSQQQNGYLPYQQFGNTLGQFTGLNGSSSTSANNGSNWLSGLLGGGLAGAQIYKTFGG